CAYFVLANPNPQDLPAEDEDRPRRKRSRSLYRNRNQKRTEPIAPKENKSNRPDRQKKGKQQNKQA
ncbi:DUF1027 domain-containing protein, partial [Streptococcus suis]